MGDWTGTVPTFTAGAKLRGVDEQTLADVLTALTAEWTPWTPILTNLTLGSGTVTARYVRLGKTIDFHFKFLLGAGSAVGTSPTFTLPVAPHSSYAALTDPMSMEATLVDTGTASRSGIALLSSGSTVGVYSLGTAALHTTITATSPHTWASTDAIVVVGRYEAA